MTVVVIMGVLASIAFASLKGHAAAARGAEALNVVQSIRAAQERWRAEHMMYLNVSQSGAWYPRDPSDPSFKNTEQAFFYPPGDGTHDDSDRWLLLRPTVTGPVRFGYLVRTGTANGAIPDPAGGPAVSWPTPSDNWYLIEAIGDTDWDGHLSYYRATNFDGEVFSVDHGE